MTKVIHLVFLLLLTITFHQTYADDLIGQVTDQVSGSALQGVMIKIVETNDSTFSDANGEYIFSNLSPGTYVLLIGAPFYYTSIRSIGVGSCCQNIRGNVDGDASDNTDISDLLYLVDYMFLNPPGPAPVCIEEADFDASGLVDITDLLYLVDYMFANPSGPEPLPCL